LDRAKREVKIALEHGTPLCKAKGGREAKNPAHSAA